MKNILAILIILLSSCILSSCTKHDSPASLNVTGIFEYDGEISLRVWDFGYSDAYYSDKIQIEESKEEQSFTFTLADSILKKAVVFEIFLTVNGKAFYIKDIDLTTKANLSAEELETDFRWLGSEIFHINENGYLKFVSDKENSNIAGYLNFRLHPFYQKHAESLLTIIRILFIACCLIAFALLIGKSSNQKIIVGCIGLYLLTLPLKLSWTNWAFAILFIAALAYYISAKKWKIKLAAPPFYNLFLIYLIICIGYLYTGDPITNFDYGISMSILIVYPLIFSVLVLNRSSINKLLHFFVRIVAIYCSFLLLNFLVIFILNTDLNLIETIKYSKSIYPFFTIYPSFLHPSFVSVIICITVPMVHYLYFNDKRIKLTVAYIHSVLVFITILLLGARIGLVLIMIISLLTLFCYINFRLLKNIILLSLIGCFCILLFYKTGIQDQLHDPIRYDLRRTAIAAIKEKPLFGWGTDRMKNILQSEDIAAKAGFEKPIDNFNHFHNQYLDMLVQFGFIGSIPFFALFAWLIYLAIKRKDFLLLAYLAIYLPFMLVESPLATVKGIQPMIFWLCFLVSTQKNRLGKSAGNIAGVS